MKQCMLRSVAVLGITLAAVGTAWANGHDFFIPAKTDRPADLVYVGRIRDKSSGSIIRDTVYVTISDKGSGMTFPFASDSPGHYRSPDIGAAVKDLGGTGVNASDLEFELLVSGYKPATITNVPRKTSGIVEMNFALERESSASAGQPQGSSFGDSGGRWIWLALAGGLAIAGVGARTFVLRQSTTR